VTDSGSRIWKNGILYYTLDSIYNGLKNYLKYLNYIIQIKYLKKIKGKLLKME
jgi:hypothetical protein